MKSLHERAIALFAVTGLLMLAGCNARQSSPAPAQGRFAGVGVTDAGRNWAGVIQANRPQSDADANRTSYDQHIITIVDSQTGAIRECGDISGYCISGPSFAPTGPTRAIKQGSAPPEHAEAGTDDRPGAASH